MASEFLGQAKSGDRRSLARTLSALENGLIQIDEVLEIIGLVPTPSALLGDRVRILSLMMSS